MNITPTEAETQAAILEYLTMRGHFCWRNNTGMHRATYGGRERFIRFGKKGSADILGIERGTGRFVAVEVKRRGNRPTPEQTQFINTIKGNHGIAVVAFSVDDVISAGL